MKISTKLKYCDWLLLVLTGLVFASGIQLEVLHGENRLWIWMHIFVCILFLLLCVWHIRLHFKRGNWFLKIRKQKSVVTRILGWGSLFVALTGCAATGHWLVTDVHGPLGAVHGKIGLLMVVLALAHVAKRRSFFSKR